MNAVVVLPVELGTSEEIIAHYAAARGRLGGLPAWRKPIYLTPRLRVKLRPVRLIPPIVSGLKRKLISPARNRAVVSDVALRHGIPESYLRKGGPRFAPISRARQEVFYRLRQEGAMSLPAVGRFMGGFHHTTVLHGERMHADRLIRAALQVATGEGHLQ
jgi:hypothetical protein